MFCRGWGLGTGREEAAEPGAPTQPVRGWHTFSIKGQTGSVFSFAGQTISVTAVPSATGAGKRPQTARKPVNAAVSQPAPYRSTAGWVWPAGRRSETPTLHQWGCRSVQPCSWCRLCSCSGAGGGRLLPPAVPGRERLAARCPAPPRPSPRASCRCLFLSGS